MSVGLLVVLSVALVAYNVAINLLPSPRWAYVPANLVLGVGLLALAGSLGIGADELGLSRDGVMAGLGWGTAAAAVIALGIGIALLVRRRVPLVARLLADRRATGIERRGLAYEALVRIPFGTALFEEVAFRSVLLAVAATIWPVSAAVAYSSVVFGLWHVGPTIATVRLNAPDAGPLAALGVVAAAVVVTTVAGIGFAVLRLASGSLLAPVLAHWASNALGLLAAAYVQRR